MAGDFQKNDGGRAAAGFKGQARDCVARAVTIASQRPYAEVYARLAEGNKTQRKSKRERHHKSRTGAATARHGICVKRKWFKDYMAELGFEWVPTMHIGQGCKVHLCAEELPAGRLVVSVSGHYTTMIDGVIHDTWDPRREVHCVRPDDGGDLKPGEWRNENGICSIQRRCVYGYWVWGNQS